MTPQEFFLKIIRAYQDARIPSFADVKIRRGRSHAISSVAEDLFAYYLISNDPGIDTVYVDQPMYFKDAKKSIYPDITVVRGNVITAFIDLKMDLGWNRNRLYDLCKNHAQTISQVAGQDCILKDGATKEAKACSVAAHASYNVAIVSSRNINPELLKKQLDQALGLKPQVEVFVLSDSAHPNQYGIEPEELAKTFRIDLNAFTKIVNKTRL